MDWKKYFQEMIKILRREEDILDRKKKDKQPMYNSITGEYGIDHWLKELGLITDGAIASLELLMRNKEISGKDAEILKYELGWLQVDLYAMLNGAYPTPHPEFSEK